MTRCLSGLFFLIAICAVAEAQTVESLVMPGDVIRGHAEYEHDCAVCHKRFDRGAQRSLCLDCHEDIAADVDGAAGLHGRSPDVADVQCATCHTDHEGRGADILGLDESSFDHVFTDFELLGKHLETACADCHVPDRKRREAPGSCIDCHRDKDPHEGFLGEACADCHSPQGWEDVSFDHDTTDFPLVGKHREAECGGCHEDKTHQNTPTDCFACHAEDDHHEGRSGAACGDCHNPTSWTDTSFDHKRDTDFPLLGKHALTECASCHSEDPFSDELDMACASCHLEDDHHEGNNGTDCGKCHGNESWTETKFDHGLDTGFFLRGKHAEAECKQCHVKPITETKPGTACATCHLDDEVHGGKQGEVCEDCHTETTWTEAPWFDHSLTDFPLLGEHENQECEQCHETKVFTDAEPVCSQCHEETEPPHGDNFGDGCAGCHNPVAWDLWLFDHDTQTTFRLDGAHVDVACTNCHRSSLQSMQRIGGRCGDCHRPDDQHDGEFGADCGRCHTARSFKELRSLQ